MQKFPAMEQEIFGAVRKVYAVTETVSINITGISQSFPAAVPSVCNDKRIPISIIIPASAGPNYFEYRVPAMIKTSGNEIGVCIGHCQAERSCQY